MHVTDYFYMLHIIYVSKKINIMDEMGFLNTKKKVILSLQQLKNDFN